MVCGFIFKTAVLVFTLIASADANAETVKITNPDGSVAEVSLFGAQVLSFRTAKNPKLDVLFLSKKSDMSGKQPARGGIPIVFPNLGSRKGFPDHGFARETKWTLVSNVISTGKDIPSVATFTMASSKATRAMWPVDFKLEYEVRLFADQLETALHVHNTCKEQIEFNALLHNYLWVDDVRNKGVQVTGLNGDYFDKLDKKNKTENREYIDFTAETDSVYSDAHNKVTAIIKGVHTVNRNVTVKKTSFLGTKLDRSAVKTKSDILLWNPWTKGASTMKDFGADDYKNTVTIAPGRVSEMQTLAAGKTFTLQQAISIKTS